MQEETEPSAWKAEQNPQAQAPRSVQTHPKLTPPVLCFDGTVLHLPTELQQLLHGYLLCPAPLQAVLSPSFRGCLSSPFQQHTRLIQPGGTYILRISLRYFPAPTLPAHFKKTLADDVFRFPSKYCNSRHKKLTCQIYSVQHSWESLME